MLAEQKLQLFLRLSLSPSWASLTSQYITGILYDNRHYKYNNNDDYY